MAASMQSIALNEAATHGSPNWARGKGPTPWLNTATPSPIPATTTSPA